MRGTEAYRQALRDLPRITPADAGNRPQKLGNGVQSEDHPRGCGEQCVWRDGEIVETGSPPRMRGTGEMTQDMAIDTGITPADAGNR